MPTMQTRLSRSGSSSCRKKRSGAGSVRSRSSQGATSA
nr:MAG: hypothetical protein [Molluscum contagiosum virus]